MPAFAANGSGKLGKHVNPVNAEYSSRADVPAAKANLSDEPIEDCVKKLDMLSDKEKYMLVLVLESVISSIRKLDAPVAQL